MTGHPYSGVHSDGSGCVRRLNVQARTGARQGRCNARVSCRRSAIILSNHEMTEKGIDFRRRSDLGVSFLDTTVDRGCGELSRRADRSHTCNDRVGDDIG